MLSKMNVSPRAAWRVRVLFTVLFFCVVGSAAAQVKGTARYRERIALPPGAIFEATLEDVSTAGAKTEVIGRARIEQPGSPPIAFEIPYDSARIDDKRRYVVRARIVLDGKPLFTTDRSYPVLTAGKGNKVTINLRRVGAVNDLEKSPAPAS
jgi:uncharacterized lipoprotein YbaY